MKRICNQCETEMIEECKVTVEGDKACVKWIIKSYLVHTTSPTENGIVVFIMTKMTVSYRTKWQDSLIKVE
ncbi:hypothetical protein V7056_13295 [Bacillus sp. JJ664]